VETPRRCVYTALTGGYEKLAEQPMAGKSALPFICFTDDPALKSETWTIRHITPMLRDDPIRSQRAVKLLAHKFLPDFDQSLYIDNTVLLKAPPEEIFAAFDLGAGLALAAHSYRESVGDEFARVSAARLDDPARIAEQFEYYRGANPEILKERPFWGGILLRDHRNATMTEAMELWFAHVLRFSRRDQLSNRFVFNQAGLHPLVLELNNFSSWFHSWPHVSARRTELRNWQKPAEAPSTSLQLVALEAKYKELARAHEAILASTTWRATEPLRQMIHGFARRPPVMELLRRPFLRRRARRLVFAFEPPASAWPSSFLRGNQMMALIHQACGDVACRGSTLAGLLQSTEELVVLTKSALVSLTPELIGRLRRRGHRLIADFIDFPMDETLAREMHALLASSVMQERHLRARFPEIPVFHVTHHVDLRLPKVVAPADRPRFGYFGRPENLMHGPAVGDLVSIVPAEDPKRPGWMRRLREFNAHCALRVPEGENSFKPFTKGFVAAHCGAPIIVGAEDAEARHYLGPDYGFVIGDMGLEPVRARLAEFAAAFGSPVWRAAVAAMREVAAQCGVGRVREELRAFLSEVK